MKTEGIEMVRLEKDEMKESEGEIKEKRRVLKINIFFFYKKRF